MKAKQWEIPMITGPLPPEQLKVVDWETTTLTLEWEAPANSGVDRYDLTYAPVEADANSSSTSMINVFQAWPRASRTPLARTSRFR